MRVFLDTSSLIKLYHEENNSASLRAFLKKSDVSAIFLSELTRIEFLSALWKKRRVGELDDLLVARIASLFERDSSQFIFIPIDENLISSSCLFLNKYGVHGLRSLDSIQLATAAALKEKADLFLTSDRLLETLLNEELLPTTA